MPIDVRTSLFHDVSLDDPLLQHDRDSRFASKWLSVREIYGSRWYAETASYETRIGLYVGSLVSRPAGFIDDVIINPLGASRFFSVLSGITKYGTGVKIFFYFPRNIL